jgi:PAS domain S-box-containing protein
MSEATTREIDELPRAIASIRPSERMLSGNDLRGITPRRRATVAAVAVFALLACACAIDGILAWRNIQASNDALDARQARRSGTLVLQAVLLAETGQRGYLLARDPAYLANYAAAKAQFASSLAALRDRSPAAPVAAPVAALARIGAEIFSDLDQTIALGQSGRFDDALAIVRSGAEKARMAEFRQALDELTAVAEENIGRSSETESRLSVLLIAAIITALFCVAGLAALLLIDARRQFGMLRGREFNARQVAETLERRVAVRTSELAEANQRFNLALRASGVTVMTQDRDLVFTWISRSVYGQSPANVIGKAQSEVIPEAALGPVTSLKRSVIETGEPARGDIRIAYGGIESWYDLTVHPLIDEFGDVTGIISGAVDITRYKEQEARIRLLMRELTHRSKNLLTVIQAIMRQTATNSTSVEDFETRFSARLQSLAGSHDLLVQEDWRGASMRDLVRSQLGHYGDRTDSQIELSGEPLKIKPDAAQHIGMALHELATNATKYGALSSPAGKVHISWRVSAAPDGTPICRLAWEETGGPPAERPSRRGFGRVVIERTVARAVNGEVHIDYAPTGLRWTLDFPAMEFPTL